MAVVNPIIAPKEPFMQKFGRVDGEYRGADESLLIYPPIERTDDYFYLRDDERTNSKVLSLIDSENSYTSQVLDNHKALKNNLYHELKAYMREEYDTYERLVPGGVSFRYFARYQAGSDYKLYCRRNVETQEVDVLLDINELAKGQRQCDVTDFTISPDQKFYSYGVDYDGSEQYELVISSIAPNARLNSVIFPKLAYCSYIWASESSIYYLKGDSKNRLCELWLYDMAKNEHTLIYAESNEVFDLSISISSDRNYLFMVSGDYDSSYAQFIQLDVPEKLTTLQPLRKSPPTNGSNDETVGDVAAACLELGSKVRPDHALGHFYLLTNRNGATNWKIIRSQSFGSTHGEWEEFIAYNPREYIVDMWLFENCVVYQSKVCGVEYVNVVDYNLETIKVIDHVRNAVHSYEGHKATLGRADASLADFCSADIANVSVAALTDNGCENPHSFTDQTIILAVNSMTSPIKYFAYELTGKSLTYSCVYTTVVPNYDEEKYGCHRIWVPFSEAQIDAAQMDMSRDLYSPGIPVSIVYRKDFFVDRATTPPPLYLYGYGSYGVTIDADFSYRVLPLLDRGYLFAIAHIRGGAFLGYDWYLDGKGRHKMNTFRDFLRVAEFLTTPPAGYCDPQAVTIEGRSAGGLLVGACLTMRPDLFKNVVLGVPFVDLLNTMCDSTIPLTTEEWTQWGNPNILEDFEYMSQYCPYSRITDDNLTAYPNMYFSAGLHDPRVQYWEPLKFLYKIREHKDRFLLREKNTNGLKKGDTKSSEITKESHQVIRIETTQGHFGGSSRYKHLEELAEKYAFIFTRE